MREGRITVDAVTYPLYSVNTVVVGSGAAGLNAALALHERGQHDLVILTEAWGGGASANAGSDKQTYYKLSLAGDLPDSPRAMAEDLVRGGCMHGDIALCEAQHSAQAFYRLVQLGVPFPHDAYGAYVGYQTDNSTSARATSAGPLTSRLMVQALAREVKARAIRVMDGHQVVRLLVVRREGEVHAAGVVALVHGEHGEASARFAIFNSINVVLATGGPGALYADSVYPPEQTGSIGVALAAGAVAQNLTESQFGLASTGVRWNLSGSYQQCIPRYLSTDADGKGDEREFLTEAFADIGALGTAVFRKGYQWPFDARLVAGGGSSLVDLLVYRERLHRNRRVFLDYTRNPDGGERQQPFSLDSLAPEARLYLQKCGASGATPIERLRQINAPAIELYDSKGVALERDWLEIAVCAQHNNGGLAGNCWWESNVRGLFPVGEVNGSHGVYRPGGAALNAGQVGGLRAAMYIGRRRAGAPSDDSEFSRRTDKQIRETLDYARRALAATPTGRLPAARVRADLQERMSRHGAVVRSVRHISAAIVEAWALYEEVAARPLADGEPQLPAVYRNLDLALAHAVYLEALGEYLARGGRSRGSCLVLDPAGNLGVLDDQWRYSLNEREAFVDGHILEVSLDAHRQVRKRWVKVRPVPAGDAWFETVWKAYRDDEVIR